MLFIQPTFGQEFSIAGVYTFADLRSKNEHELRSLEPRNIKEVCVHSPARHKLIVKEKNKFEFFGHYMTAPDLTEYETKLTGHYQLSNDTLTFYHEKHLVENTRKLAFKKWKKTEINGVEQFLVLPNGDIKTLHSNFCVYQKDIYLLNP